MVGAVGVEPTEDNYVRQFYRLDRTRSGIYSHNLEQFVYFNKLHRSKKNLFVVLITLLSFGPFSNRSFTLS